MNYDDIFEAAQPKREPERASFRPFDKEAWIAQKQQDRDRAYTMIDETAKRLGSDAELFQTYLDVQARFDRYSVGNALLIAAQKPDMTEPGDAKAWKDKGVFIKKGEVGALILEPGEEYTKQDGSIGVSYNAKKVFDISQTTAHKKPQPTVAADPRLLLKALIHNAPCKMQISDRMQENVYAVYKPEDKTIYIRQGLEAHDIFRSLSNELAYAHMDRGDNFKRHDCQFTAYCVAYILCKRNGIPTQGFHFERMPSEMQNLEPKDIRNALSKIRDVANEISSDMRQVLDKQRNVKSRDDGAR